MTMTADGVTLTRDELKEFCALVCDGLNLPETGDPVPEHYVAGLHSDAIAEDGARVRLFDLHDGRTAVQVDDDPLRYAD